jgi:hypothetical protein
MIVGVQTSIDTGGFMPSPSQEIIQLLSVFARVFTLPTFTNAMVLLYGTILAPGRRTVAAALRTMGLADSKHFTNYHRVLNSSSLVALGLQPATVEFDHSPPTAA